MTAFMDVLLFGFLLVTAIGIVRTRDLFAAAMLGSLFSLLSAGLFMVMDAADVAFTEAAVGAGISTVLFLATLGLTHKNERDRPGPRMVPLLVVTATGALLVWGTLDLPEYGDPDAPAHTYMTPRFLDETPREIGIPNIVTAVLASYRGYDTFGEATVVFTAALGVLLLLSNRRREDGEEESTEPVVSSGLRALREQVQRGQQQVPEMRNRILRMSVRPLIPAIMLFGLYVQFHGDYGPGGGFQAGVIFAAGVVLYGLVFGLERTRRAFPSDVIEAAIAGGVLLYGSVGVVSILRGGNFLDYDVLAEVPSHGQHLGIILIELGVGITVAAVMLGLFLLFAARGLRRPSREA
ncbi:MAG: DUF4040 domain-containing protein [Acidobacteriota bacterium]